ncbi:MAG: hypothetical protein WB630_01760, partial [Candidatus Acidiferrales bacterium]
GTPGLGELPVNGIIGGVTNFQYSDTELLILVTPRVAEFASAHQEHVIYAGRGQLSGTGSLGPTIQERRGGFQPNPEPTSIPSEQQPPTQQLPPPQQQAPAEQSPALPPPANPPPQPAPQPESAPPQ